MGPPVPQRRLRPRHPLGRRGPGLPVLGGSNLESSETVPLASGERWKSSDLIKLISDQSTRDLLDWAALGLGVPREGVQWGLAGAVPALLSGLIGVTEQPGGADRLMAAVKGQQQREPDLLSSLGSILDGSGQCGRIQQGSSVIAGLLGSGAASGLASAIAGLVPTSVKQAVDVTVGIPGVGDLIKPVLKRIVAILETLAKP